MKIIIRTLVVITAIFAMLAPAWYGGLFYRFSDWSAVVDLALVVACLVLAFAAFKPILFVLWMTAFITVLGFAVSGFFHHFRDSGESGPLPFEWLNGYFLIALPLLLLSALTQFLETKKSQKAEMATSRKPADLIGSLPQSMIPFKSSYYTPNAKAM